MTSNINKLSVLILAILETSTGSETTTTLNNAI